ncbi:hypothetical protein ACQFZT_004310 [Providencia stuartii]|uniref:hypothetical protein n=1 Tax=Providencia TaxID=586 RepID=UPI0018C673DB|nr:MULTISPECIES: hypothetical protein [Providencia]MBG5906825.1 hypothetical protein [Providencia stuartii]HEM6896064.1 hypothetical protein [Providencia stuartii]
MDNIQDVAKQLKHVKSQIKQLDDAGCQLSDLILKADEKMNIIKGHILVQQYILKSVLAVLPEDSVESIYNKLQHTFTLDDKPKETKALLEYLDSFFKR